MMSTHYQTLLSNGHIGHLITSNRVIMAPMAMNYADSQGNVTAEVINYYVERAIGDVGLIIIENCNVDYPLGHNGAVQLRLDKDNYIPGMARLCEAIKDANQAVKVALQINHGGGQTTSDRIEGHQVVAPSAVPTKIGGETPRALNISEIIAIEDKFALTAKRAKLAGFDAIEIHGGFGYLVSQFLSPACNHRTDQYGGSIENRARFAIEIVKKVRHAVGERFPILFRLNGTEFTQNGTNLEEGIEYAKLLELASVNLLHVTAGSGFKPTRHIEPMSYKQGAKVEVAHAIKQKVNIPVATVGVIREPEFAEQILVSGKADFVALGRALIADPHWVKKVKEGRRINRCISCNECARRRVFAGLPVRCSVNPLVGNEILERQRQSCKKHCKKSLNIIIVGGGPAGLKAAIEARYDQHHVTLLERESLLGGRALTAAKPPHKEKIHWLIEDLIAEAKRLNVDIRLNCDVTPEMLTDYKPDILIVAVGSVDTAPNWLNTQYCSLGDSLLKDSNNHNKGKIVIIGGGSVGCELAEYLALSPDITNITLLEMATNIVPDLDPISRQDLLERINTNPKINIKTNSRVISVEEKSVIYQNKDKEERQESDLVIYTGGLRKPETFLTQLQSFNAQYPVYVIGDSYISGRFVNATRQAYMAVKNIRTHYASS